MLALREPAHAQHLRRYHRERRGCQSHKHAHADLGAQLPRRQQHRREEQAHAESNGGGQSNDNQLARAEAVRQVKTSGNSNACPNQHPYRLACDQRDRQRPRSWLQRSKWDSGVDYSEEEQRHLGRISPPYFESVQRILRIRRRVDKKSGIARRMRQKRHDRHQRQRGIQSGQE